MSKKASKRYRALPVVSGEHGVESALQQVLKQANVKFDENVEMAIALNLLKKHVVRDTMVLPHSFGKAKRVVVFAKDKRADAASAAGADHVGGAELIDKIKGGWLDFDVAIAAPDMMRELARIAQLLGTRGLMPSPKAKTVTPNVAEAVKAVKAGRREFRANGDGVLNFVIGKKSMPVDALLENARVFYEAVLKGKPADLKGDYIRSLYVTTTMGRSIKLAARALF